MIPISQFSPQGSERETVHLRAHTHKWSGGAGTHVRLTQICAVRHPRLIIQMGRLSAPRGSSELPWELEM